MTTTQRRVLRLTIERRPGDGALALTAECVVNTALLQRYPGEVEQLYLITTTPVIFPVGQTPRLVLERLLAAHAILRDGRPAAHWEARVLGIDETPAGTPLDVLVTADALEQWPLPAGVVAPGHDHQPNPTRL